MITITITIGRNIGAVPMDDTTWAAALDAIRTAIARPGTAFDIYVDAASGTGTWDGITESNATFVAAVSPLALNLIRESISDIAGAYHQDAIAFTVGSTDLITPAVNA